MTEKTLSDEHVAELLAEEAETGTEIESEVPESTQGEQTEAAATEDTAETESASQSDSESSEGDGEKTGDEKPDKPERVPLAELMEERSKRRAANSELEELKEKWARVEERLANPPPMQQQDQAQQQQPRAEMPGDDDPMGQLAFLKGKWEEAQEHNTRVQQQNQQQQEMHEAAQREWNAITAEWQQIAQEVPGIQAPYEYWIKGRDAELQAQGVIDPQARAQQIANEEWQHYRYAKSRNIPLEKYVYDTAVAKGWQEQSATPQQDNETREKLAKIAEGQDRNKSLGTSDSDGPDMSLERMANMSDDQWAKWSAQNPKEHSRFMQAHFA